MTELKTIVENAWINKDLLNDLETTKVIKKVISELDKGTIRVE